MNLHIASNSKSRGLQKNLINNFEMKISYPIDALNNDCYLEVLQVCYPQTTKNVVGDTCFISFKIEIRDFILTKNNSEFIFTSDKFIIPEGIYDLSSLITFLNNILEGFEIVFKIGSNGKVIINVNTEINYYEMGKLSNKSVDIYADNPHAKFNQKITLYFSKKLAFMLGIQNKNDDVIVPVLFEVKQATKNPKTLYSTHFKYLPDVSEGLNKMYIYCDEIELGLVGDSCSELLTTVPIQWSHQNNTGNGQLVNFNPPKALRKFKKEIIRTLHIKVKDTTGELVSFDSGSLSIDCLVHSS